MIRTGKQIAAELRSLGAYQQYRSDGVTGRGIYWLFESGGQIYTLSRSAGQKLTEGMVRDAKRISHPAP